MPVFFKEIPRDTLLTSISFEEYQRHHKDKSVDPHFDVTFDGPDGNCTLTGCRVLSLEKIANYNQEIEGYPSMLAQLPDQCAEESFTDGDFAYNYPAMFYITIYDSDREAEENRLVLVKIVDN